MKKPVFKIEVSYLILVLLSLNFGSCNNKAVKLYPSSKFISKTQEDIGLSKSMKNLTDSFTVELKKYTSKGINLVCYIKIIDSKDNNGFKILFQGIESEKLFDKVVVDDYFVKNGFYFCIDYNLSKLLNTNKFFSKEEIIKYSKIKEYQAADTRIPAWLVEITNDTITRMNKNANSLFGPKRRVGYFTKKGIVYYDVTEWGEVIDNNGKVINHFDGK